MAAKKNGRAIRQFVVGNKEDGADFSTEEIEHLIYRIAYWYSTEECGRVYSNPIEEAQKHVQGCLLGITDAGEPWKSCPAEFSNRVKAKCAYDMIEGRGIPSPRVKRPEGGLIRNPHAKGAARDLTTGGSVQTAIEYEGLRKEIEDNLYAAFPELNNPASEPLVRSLSLYHAQREVIDRELQIGVNMRSRGELLTQLKDLETMIGNAMTKLGIHPTQLKKDVQEKGAGTVADLVATLESDAEFKERERIWALQAALQLYWMSEHHNGKKTGPQLHDFEIWHLTRSRPIRFKCRCGEEYYPLIEGFLPHELRDYLIERGVLVEEPAIPGIISKEDIAGLAKADLTPEATA